MTERSYTLTTEQLTHYAAATKLALHNVTFEGFKTINYPWRFRHCVPLEPPTDEQTKNVIECISSCYTHFLEELRGRQSVKS